MLINSINHLIELQLIKGAVLESVENLNLEERSI